MNYYYTILMAKLFTRTVLIVLFDWQTNFDTLHNTHGAGDQCLSIQFAPPHHRSPISMPVPIPISIANPVCQLQFERNATGK